MKNPTSNKELTYQQLIYQAEQLYSNCSFSEALEFITAAIEMNHTDSWAYYLRGSIRFSLKDIKGSNADFEKSTELGACLTSDLDRLMNLSSTEK